MRSHQELKYSEFRVFRSIPELEFSGALPELKSSGSVWCCPESFGVVRGRLESSEVVWSHLESFGVGVILYHLESFRVVRSHPALPGVNRSHLE